MSYDYGYDDRPQQRRTTKSQGPGEDYVEVKERIQWFYATYPTGALVTSKMQMLVIGGNDYVVVQAQAFRTADDPHPGTGSSWMLVPGKTPYTTGSELENTETSAWGRAIASIGGLVDRGIASAQEIRSKEGGSIEQPSKVSNADRLRDAAAKAAGEEPAVEAPPEKPKKGKAAPKPEEAPPSPSIPADVPEAAPDAPVAGEAVPEAPVTQEQAPAPVATAEGMNVVRNEDGQPGLDYEEFTRIAREKFIPTGHLAATARNLVERGAIPPTDSVKKMTDQNRLDLLLAAIASFEEAPSTGT